MLGAAASFLIGWYFFRRSLAKRLAVHIQYSTELLGGLEPALRDRLSITLDGQPAAPLFQLQFIVANQAVRSIQPIRPLTLELPPSAKVLDVQVVHVHPLGRSISTRIQPAAEGGVSIEFAFEVLNKGEGFVVRLLLSGELLARDLRFHITSDDLPPTIQPTGWGVSRYGITPPANLGAVLPMAVFGMLGAALLYSAVALARLNPTAMPVPWAQFQPSIESLAIAATFALGLVLVLLGMVSSVAQDGRPFFNAVVPSIPIPDKLQRPGWILPDMHGRYPQSHGTSGKDNRLV